VPSPKKQILDLVADAGYPLSKGELLSRLDAAAADAELVGLATAIDDDEFVSEEELAHRLEDALGMPDADTRQTAISVDPDWRE